LADFSAKALKFKLRFAALKEAKNDFFNSVPKALQAEEVTVQELNTAPIFEEMREDERFKQYYVSDAELKEDLELLKEQQHQLTNESVLSSPTVVVNENTQ
jgi:hypothetical protein